MSEPTVKRILLVEDEDNLRELVSGRLEANGYQVSVAEDGYKALTLAKELHPDLVILDLMLPKMDGYAVCRMIRSGMADTQVPIILFSARSSEDDRRRGLDCGANAYVTKPFDPPVLLDKVRELTDPAGWAAAHVEPPSADDRPDATPAGPAAAAPGPAPRAPAAEAAEAKKAAPAPTETAPVPGTSLTPGESAARARPDAAPAETAAAPAPAASDQERPGFFARLLARLFGSGKK
jgi:CheY-like chemotaxis protein